MGRVSAGDSVVADDIGDAGDEIGCNRAEDTAGDIDDIGVQVVHMVDVVLEQMLHIHSGETHALLSVAPHTHVDCQE